MVSFPAAVTATSFIHGGTTATLTATATPISSADCGFNYVSGGSYDSTYISSVGGTKDGSGSLYTAMTLDVNVFPNSGSSGFQYLEGELYFGCYNVASSPAWTATLTITPTSFTPSADWYAVFVTPDSGSTTTYESSQSNWCNPTTSAQGGTSCSGTPVACGSYTPNVYLPVNTLKALTQGTSGNEWVFINGAYVSAASSCGENTVGPSGISLPATTNTIDYLEDIGFGFGDTSTISGTIELTYTLNI